MDIRCQCLEGPGKILIIVALVKFEIKVFIGNYVDNYDNRSYRDLLDDIDVLVTCATSVGLYLY